MLLIACEECDRQYDVSHLTPADLVHCVCDAMLVVGARSPLTVEALCCKNCGGVVGVDDEGCPYCDGRLSAEDRQRTTLCPKCFVRIEDDSRHCRGCGVAIQPTALTPLPPERACPACDGELAHRPIANIDAVECQGCQGLWFGTEVFEQLCREAASDSLPRLDATEGSVGLDPVERKRTYLPCLKCRQLMLRRQFRWGRRASGVVIDSCKGHGLWLDDRELEKIVTYLREGGGGAPLVGPGGSEPRRAEAFSLPAGGAVMRGQWGLRDVVDVLASWLF